ncbi:hypothetical protein LWI28_004872 [Acer negundo]|uniref:Kiwellin n=1 Tax=Acer negundo TaxID=4023 RepID=A0AAD5JCC3_ACENE|nr:hypothetical protein LWI28_004872 [Acer negundo]KAK4854998.1 hypothetical protein QYF36_003073 [Acer negundo]
MANTVFLSVSLLLVFTFMSSPFLSNAISSCNGPCQSMDDCDGQLICTNGKCNDDPDVGTHVCSTGGGGDGGDPSECDEQYHDNTELVVALSTGWYDGGSRCGKMIRITAAGIGKSVEAKVVDECDSMRGCDKEHAGQPPCKNNIVDGSDAVWDALELNKDLGVVDVTWSMT